MDDIKKQFVEAAESEFEDVAEDRLKGVFGDNTEQVVEFAENALGLKHGKKSSANEDDDDKGDSDSDGNDKRDSDNDDDDKDDSDNDR